MLTVVQCAEDRLAAEVSAALLDRVVRERARAEWLRDCWAPETVDTHRQIVDLEGSAGWSDRGAVRRVQQGARLRLHMRDPRTRRPLGGNAALAYVCVRLASMEAAPGDGSARVLLLAFDTDGKSELERCTTGVDAARSDAEPGIDILVAEAHREFDAWVVAGFVPGPRHEKVSHEEEKSRIGFDPLEAPHELTSNVTGDARDAKALCTRLLRLDGPAHLDHERVRACVIDTDLGTLQARGQGAGIAQYLGDVARVVLPLLGDHA